jgi:hypothetical protein
MEENVKPGKSTGNMSLNEILMFGLFAFVLISNDASDITLFCLPAAFVRMPSLSRDCGLPKFVIHV